MYLCLTILAAAAACDLVSGQIPMRVTMTGFILGQLYALTVKGSITGALYALLAGLSMVVLLYPLFAIGALGGGDIKLIMMFPAFMDLRCAVIVTFISFVMAAAAGIIKLIRAGILGQRLKFFLLYLHTVEAEGRLVRYDLPPSVRGGMAAHQIHFSLPLLAAATIYFGGLWKIL